MDYIDTICPAEALDGTAYYQFDMICLVGLTGSIGESVWYVRQLTDSRPRGPVRPPPIGQRLLVQVRSERDAETARRIREALGLAADQFYS